MRRARGRKVKQESSLTHRVSVMHTNPKRQRGSITLLTKGRSRGIALSHEARYAMIILANQPSVQGGIPRYETKIQPGDG